MSAVPLVKLAYGCVAQVLDSDAEGCASDAFNYFKVRVVPVLDFAPHSAEFCAGALHPRVPGGAQAR